MLVLTRKKDEEILIGDRVVIKVLRIRGSSVQIGIEAPDDVEIVRAELTVAAGHEEVSMEGTGRGPCQKDGPPALPSQHGFSRPQVSRRRAGAMDKLQACCPT